MATYKKQLKDSNGDLIYPAQGVGTITDANIDWTTTAQSYSLIEVDTGATWIDGSHIYKKTVDIGNLPNNTSKSVAHNISSLSLVLKFEGYFVISGTYYPLPFVGVGDTTSSVRVTASSTNVIVTTGTNRSSATGYVTIWYTKSS